MSRGTRVIEQHGEAGAGGCLGPYLHWRENTVVTEELVRIGEAGVGLCELRIFGDRSLE